MTFDDLTALLPRLDEQQLLTQASDLARVIPELAPMIGFDQRSPHHAYDLMTHVAKVVAAVPGDPALRWAALLHDIGKVPTFTQDETGRGHFYGHAGESAAMADRILLSLHAPEALRQQVVTLIARHMMPLSSDPATLSRQLALLGRDTLEKLLLLQRADMGSKGTGADLTLFDEIQRTLTLLLHHSPSNPSKEEPQ